MVLNKFIKYQILLLTSDILDMVILNSLFFSYFGYFHINISVHMLFINCILFVIIFFYL